MDPKKSSALKAIVPGGVKECFAKNLLLDRVSFLFTNITS
jgi:hypothetical protein